MKGSRMWLMPMVTPRSLRMSASGASIRCSRWRVLLITPLSCSSTVQAYVRTRMLDQNGTRTSAPSTAVILDPARSITYAYG